MRWRSKTECEVRAPRSLVARARDCLHLVHGVRTRHRHREGERPWLRDVSHDEGSRFAVDSELELDHRFGVVPERDKLACEGHRCQVDWGRRYASDLEGNFPPCITE